MPLYHDGNVERTPDAQRSAACMRACEGIPTELLERGFLLKLIAACVHVKDPRVREVLEELALHRLPLLDREARGSAERRRGASDAGRDPDLRTSP